MNAKYLFRRLGYTKHQNKAMNYFEYTQRNEQTKETIIISFDGTTKTIMAWLVKDGQMQSRALAMTPAEIIAINMQLHELGWHELGWTKIEKECESDKND